MSHSFDPGYVAEPFLTLCADYPEASVYPPTQFRLEWGPIFHRGRLDGSARVQTVAAEDNPRFHQLLTEFERQTGCAVLVNTSFNVRGEPPVCTPDNAYRCFMRTGMDYLVLGNFLVAKTAQPKPAPYHADELLTAGLD